MEGRPTASSEVEKGRQGREKELASLAAKNFTDEKDNKGEETVLGPLFVGACIGGAK